MLNIEIIPCLNDNYSYLLYDKESNITAIIDPSDFDQCDQIIKKKYNKLDYILNTHHHLDHVGGNQKLKEKYKSKILGSEIDKDRIPGIDITLREKQHFKIGNVSFDPHPFLRFFILKLVELFSRHGNILINGYRFNPIGITKSCYK